MQLIIRDSSQIIDYNFGNWLTNTIKIKIISNIKKYNFINWENYLNNSDSVTRLYTKKYNIYELIQFAASSLICEATPGELVIKFNQTKMVPGFDRLLLKTILKTINYGTIDMKGCPIFTDTFKETADNINLYVRLYYGI